MTIKNRKSPLSPTRLTSSLKQLACLALALFGFTAHVIAHDYYVGLTDLSYSEEKQRLEIIHLYTSHDLEAILKTQHECEVTAEHPKFEVFVRRLIEQDFQLNLDAKKLNLEWVGFEFDYDKIVVYQEVAIPLTGKSLEIHHEVISNYFPRQVNTVNYQLGQNKGTLVFDQLKQSANITLTHN